jgi:hypothetical protein
VSTRITPATDTIRELGSWDPDGATDLHETIRTLSGVSEAVGGAYRQIADTLDEAGVNSDFPDNLRQSAGAIDSTADGLEGRLSGGLMSSSGGRAEGTSPRVRGVIEEIEDLGRWEPDDPEDLHETIAHLSGITGAVRSSYHQIAETVGQTGAHESYPPALSEAAEALGAISTELSGQFSHGVMRRPT